MEARQLQNYTEETGHLQIYTEETEQLQSYTEDDYYALPDGVHAELIDGQFYYMASPSRVHQRILGKLYRIIGDYIDAKHGSCEVYMGPFAVKLFDDTKNIVEPDISVICDPDKLTDKGCSGAPDWIIEIASPSNPMHDYALKLKLYNTAGVREYWIVDPKYGKVIVYNMEDGNLILNTYSFSDTVKAGIYEDLYIDFSGLDI